MPLRHIKKPDGAIVAFERADCTVTSQRSRDHGCFAMHDLMHYAVESAMGWGSAFLGLPAAGHEIDEWENASSPLRTDPPPESIHAETLVGVLQIKRSTEGPEALRSYDPDELNGYLDTHFASAAVPAPEPVTRAQIEQIANEYHRLVHLWADVPTDGTLELPWPARND